MTIVLDFAIMGAGLTIMELSTRWGGSLLKKAYQAALTSGDKSVALAAGRAYYKDKNRGWFGLNLFN